MADGKRLEGKVAIVTGGTRGIGRALVEKLTAEGAAVGFSYLNSEAAAAALVGAVEGRAGAAFAARADVRDRDQVEALVARTASEFDGVDIAINNAHMAYQGKWFEEASWDDFQREIDTLLKGPFNVIQAVLPHLKARGGGAIVNVGSTMAHTPRPRHSFYIAAKNALFGLTQALAVELGGHGVRVNMVTPGPLATEHNATYPQEAMARLGAETPLYGRLGTCEEVADAIAMMVMDEARFVTGANVLAAGGFSIA